MTPSTKSERKASPIAEPVSSATAVLQSISPDSTWTPNQFTSTNVSPTDYDCRSTTNVWIVCNLYNTYLQSHIFIPPFNILPLHQPFIPHVSIQPLWPTHQQMALAHWMGTMIQHQKAVEKEHKKQQLLPTSHSFSINALLK